MARLTTAKPTVAAFDVDGTLTTRDCVVPFLRRVRGVGGLAGALAARSGRLVPALVRRDRDAVKAVATEAAFTDRPVAEVEALGTTFAAEVHHDWLRAEVVDRLHRHRADGHTVVLVSASFGAYLRPLAALLGGAAVIATELEIDGNGICTGRLDGGNCRGAAKVLRLHEWLSSTAGGRSDVELWAYGDSPGDRPLLADADHAVWVGRR